MGLHINKVYIPVRAFCWRTFTKGVWYYGVQEEEHTISLVHYKRIERMCHVRMGL
jgi:hypothetical protein